MERQAVRHASPNTLALLVGQPWRRAAREQPQETPRRGRLPWSMGGDDSVRVQGVIADDPTAADSFGVERAGMDELAHSDVAEAEVGCDIVDRVHDVTTL